MSNEEILKSASDRLGVLAVLNEFAPNVNIRMPISKKLGETSVCDLEISVRSKNCLRRANANDVNQTVDIIMSEKGLSSIRNLGKKSEAEIKSLIIAEAYDELSEKEKLEFWKYVAEHN